MGRGLFITLEGIEGSGKTTHAASLARSLRHGGCSVLVSHEPGGTRAGEFIRKIFLDPGVSLDVAAELLLVLADRAQHVREKLRPAVEAGDFVISDRYSDSTVAYQGHGRGFDLDLLGKLNRLATDGMTPDLTIVLDLPVEAGLARSRARLKGTGRHPDRFERERIEFHKRVREGFLAIARARPDRVVVINSERPRQSVSRDIRRALDELKSRRRCP